MAKAAQQKKSAADEVEFFCDIEQGGEEWFAFRRSIPTASRFASILAQGEGKMRTRYLYQLAGEALCGETAETFRNDAMDRGKAMEAEARDYYQRTRFADLKSVGFVRRTIRNPLGGEFVVGASPDSQITEHKGLEIKTIRPDLMIEIAVKGAAGFPSEHRAQIQGTMWVTGWTEVDLVLFYRGMPIAPTFTVMRDDAYIAQLAIEVERFDYELRQLVKRIKEMAR